MKITILGAGYVGLVSGACFAEFGVDVALVDNDPARIEALRAGRMPIYEPGLDRLVADNVRDGRLTFHTELAPAMAGAEAVFLAVGTPSRRGDGHADLSYVFAAAEQVARVRSILEGLGLAIATPDEAREILALKGGDQVGF